MSSLPETGPATIRSPSAMVNADLESARRHSIRVLGSVAAALEAAGHQKQTLLAQVRSAEQALRVLTNERHTAEVSLATSRARVGLAVADLERAEAKRLTVLTELETLVHARLANQEALTAEVAACERQRTELRRLLAASPSAGVETAVVTVREPTARADKRSLRVGLAQLAAEHPLHPGFGNVATGLFIGLLFAMAILLSPLSQVFGGVQLLAVTSASMAPAISTGSVVAVRPVAASDLKVGDVITFAKVGAPDVLVTHRIVSLEIGDGQTLLTTKGDANDAVDALSAPASRAVGRVEFALPWVGDVMVWLGSSMAKSAGVGLAIVALALTLASVQQSRNIRPSTQ